MVLVRLGPIDRIHSRLVRWLRSITSGLHSDYGVIWMLSELCVMFTGCLLCKHHSNSSMKINKGTKHNSDKNLSRMRDHRVDRFRSNISSNGSSERCSLTSWICCHLYGTKHLKQNSSVTGNLIDRTEHTFSA